MNWKEKFRCWMPEILYNFVFYYYNHLKIGAIPKFLNLKNPKTFNEKVIWSKIYYRHPDAHILTDKYRAKEYVKEKIGEQYIIPNIAIFDDASQFDIDALPDKFVLKANHASSWNIICTDKSKLDVNETMAKLKKWLSTSYAGIGKEHQYENIPPKIVCEEFLETPKDEPLLDYRFFCFAGKPLYVVVDLEHNKRYVYDTEWNKMPFTIFYPRGKKELEKPEKLNEMLDIATKLSSGFKFVRIDLYYNNNKIYFGEITFHHGGGFQAFFPRKYDRILGDMIQL